MARTTRDYLTIIGGLAVLATLASPWAEARTYAARTLSWECPTTRVDGSRFSCTTDAAGYDLEVTAPAGNAPTIVELPASALSHVITADPPGTRYRLRCCDKAGACGEWSQVAKNPARPARVMVTVQ